MREALSCNGRNGLNNGPVLASSIGELNVTLDGDAAKAQARDIGCGYLSYASGRNCYAQTCADETHDRQPLRCLLHNVGTKAVLFTDRDRLLVRKSSG